MESQYPNISKPSYSKAGKINIKDLSELVNEEKSKTLERELEKYIRLKHGRTGIVNYYLKITTIDYITSLIAKGIMVNVNLIILYTELINEYEVKSQSHWGRLPIHDRDEILNTPLCDLDIFEENLTHYVIDRNKSIIQMIKDVVPDGYRVSSMYGGQPSNNWGYRKYEVTIRNGSVLCNDPCCLVFCCFNKSWLYNFFTTKYDESDPCPTRCCCTGRCCCGP